MAKSRSREKSGSSRGKQTAHTAKNVDVTAIRRTIIRLVALAASDMVKAAIEEAKKGHSPALKYLFEMAGFFPATLETEQAEKREMSLAELFCRELGLPLQPPSEADREGEEDREARPAEGHAVK